VADKKHSYDFDFAVIGGGSAGYAAARTAAGLGLKTVVIEGGREVGGLCILRGCMPTKALLYASEVMHLASHAEPFGVRAEDVSFNFTQVMAARTASLGSLRITAANNSSLASSSSFALTRSLLIHIP